MAKSLRKPIRYRNEAYLQFIRDKPCFGCGRGSSRAHHVSYVDGTGQGTKPSDLFTIPLCEGCHAIEHSKPMGREEVLREICRSLANWIMWMEEDHERFSD